MFFVKVMTLGLVRRRLRRFINFKASFLVIRGIFIRDVWHMLAYLPLVFIIRIHTPFFDLICCWYAPLRDPRRCKTVRIHDSSCCCAVRLLHASGLLKLLLDFKCFLHLSFQHVYLSVKNSDKQKLKRPFETILKFNFILWLNLNPASAVIFVPFSSQWLHLIPRYYKLFLCTWKELSNGQKKQQQNTSVRFLIIRLLEITQAFF